MNKLPRVALGTRPALLLLTWGGIATAVFGAPPPQSDSLGRERRTQAPPLKVFILAGQSNMQGHAKISTFDYIGDDPATAPLLSSMRDAKGQPRALERVWISSIGCLGDAYSDLTEKVGPLTAGFGAPGDKIGPEFTFGIHLEQTLEPPILLIKAAWGGRSLHTDFRPPSAGPYAWSEFELARLKERGDDPEKARAKKIEETGVFYRHMIAHVKKVLADPKRVCPEYDPKHGFELAGFVWMHGFNDLVSDWTYDQRRKEGGYQLYTDLLAHLIRDVRRELSAPQMPVVIGVMGIDGKKGIENLPHKHFREAQAAAAALPEFQGNVVAVQTAPFWSEELAAIDAKREKVSQMEYFLRSKHKDHANKDGKMTKEEQREYLKKFEAEIISPAEAALWKRGASNAGYHYLGCAKTFALMGRAFADALLGLRGPSVPPWAPNTVIPRETRNISGWQVHIHRELLKKERGATERALVLLKRMLDEIVRVVPAKAVVELKKVPLYFSPTYTPGRSGAEFHPDAAWLRDHGRDPAMAGAVEFSGVADFEAEMDRMPNFALHELAHAYHFRVLEGGFDNAEIKAAFDRAKASGNYDLVERRHGTGKPTTREMAYAMTDPMEYFAECSEAYFVKNDFFPFNRADLVKHDPGVAALLERLWGAASEGPGKPAK